MALTARIPCVLSSKGLHSETLLLLPCHLTERTSYAVQADVNMDKLTTEVSEEIKTLQSNFPKTVVFVRSYKDCSCLLHGKKKIWNVFYQTTKFSRCQNSGWWVCIPGS